MNKLVRISLISMMVAGCTLILHAGPIAAYTDPTGVGTQNYGGTFGMDFKVNTSAGINISSLGAFDANQNGFINPVTVSIYNLNDTTAALFSLILPAGTGGVVLGGDRFYSLSTPQYLAAGSYSIVAHYTAGDANGNSLAAGVNFATLNDGGGLISFIGDSRFTFGSGFPTNLDAAVAKFGAGSFTFDKAATTQDTSAPEPGSIALMGGGLVALGLLSRRFKFKQ